jgi:DNA end-binding protein Ku
LNQVDGAGVQHEAATMASDARSIASLTISFGLVAIPVKLYSATIAAERISFNMLHKRDGSRLKQQYVCATEGTVVDRSEIVKGYEFAKDQYVMFTPEEIKELEEAGSSAIDIGEFVPLESVDPVYFERTYYLAPDKGGSKPYTLLVTALRETKQCAIGKWAARGREHIVVIRPIDKGLAMHQLHFQAEVRPIADLVIEPANVSEAELKLARQLIGQQSAKTFDAASYVDEFKGRVEAAIQKKVEGKEISLAEKPAAAKQGGNVIDLMDMLRASLESRGSSDLSARKPPKRAPKAPRRAAKPAAPAAKSAPAPAARKSSRG